LRKSCGKETQLSSWENFYIQIYQQEGLLIEKQDIPDLNPLFTITQVRQHGTGPQADRYTHNNTQTHAQSRSALHTHTHTHTHTQG